MAVANLTEALSALNDTRVRLNLAESMPEITADNLELIGVLPQDQLNEFMGMFNLILQERCFRTLFDATDNPFRAFMIDMRDDGFGIRDIMQNIIDGVTPMWDNPSDAAIAEDLVAYAGDDFEQKYHTKRIQKQFKASTNEREYRKVFTAYGIVNYMQNKIANLNSSAEYWLMTTVLDELKTQIEADKLVTVKGLNLNDAQGIKNAIESVKTVMRGALQPTRLFNKDGILTKAQDESFLYLITTPEKLERITTQVLSGTFNMPLIDLSKYKVLLAPVGYDLGEITVDDGGGESHTEDVQFVVLDRLAFPVGIKTWEMRTFNVPNTLWVNNWLSVEGVLGIDSFMTGVAFTGEYGDFHEGGDSPEPELKRIPVLIDMTGLTDAAVISSDNTDVESNSPDGYGGDSTKQLYYADVGTVITIEYTAKASPKYHFVIWHDDFTVTILTNETQYTITEHDVRIVASREE